MVDSSSWTIPDSESGGCQLGILEEFFLEAKSKMATGDYVLRNIFASKPIRNTIWCLPFKVNESNDDKHKLFV